MWARMSDAELLERSAIVVQGSLIGQSPIRTTSGEDLLLGVIKVDAVLKGPGTLTVVFLVLPAPGRPISSSDLVYRVGQSGLWFLRQRSEDETGIYLADHPQRFAPAGSASAQIKALQALLPKRE